jgi:hypothetical protein
MTKKEFHAMVGDLHRAGISDEKILEAFYLMYADGRLSYDAFCLFADELGYVPSPDFEKMSEAERKQAGFIKKGGRPL